MPFGLENSTISLITCVFRKYTQIREVLIYGSRAMGKNRPGSDIDLTIKGEELTLPLIFKIERELDELNLAFTFNLSIFEQIDNRELLEHIEKNGVIFYKAAPH